PNVRPIGFTPLEPLARTCSAVINHGGAGTVLTMLGHGVPQVIIPRVQFDEKFMAAGVERAGAGLVLGGRSAVGGRELRDAVVRVLSDPDLRQGAARTRDLMHALPAPTAFVDTLVSEVRAAARMKDTPRLSGTPGRTP
ncbi:glycosyltransferase, partial [Nocardiopsis changdeensis]|uniref:glycosyltransferase n=1 Tax=Nocardiopsis changdeensis TaxID=2831969 RepID=UPI003F474677